MSTPTSSPRRRAGAGARPEGLGTFGGVFTPSILTILGIILFLRHGWVVGNAGLGRALLLIAVAHAVSALTSVSLAAIATNRRVEGGGDYFLISRSLGPEFGGALGLTLFLAQSISVAFYCLGFGEAAAALLGDRLSAQALAASAAVVLFAIAFLGADLATRFQFGIMLVVGAALVSFFVGAGQIAQPANLSASWGVPANAPGFWAVFAIFFPAVTGFTQGVSMSGDLANPSKSLPLGTFAAVTLSLLVYSLAAVAFASAAPLSDLAADYRAFERLSYWGPLFSAGVIAATLSSALASFMGAPRILQALSRDGIFPWLNLFAAGTGDSDNPRRALALSALIAALVFVLGDLNAVARLISMFFLISYGLLNLATYVEARGASPRFRPRYRFFDARLSLVGSVLCAAAMLAIDIWAAVAAFALVAGLHRHLRNQEISVPWADSRPAYNFRRLKESIHEIARVPISDWDWQPNLLVFGGNPERRDLLARFGAAFSGASGFATTVGVVEAESDLESAVEERQQLEETLRQEVESQGIDAFAMAVAAPNLRVAISTLLQTWGIGPVRANSILLDWWEHLPSNESADEELRYGRQLRSFLRMGCHVLVLDVTGKQFRQVRSRPPAERRIDVWWWEGPSCRLGLLLAYLMTRTPEWEESPIRVLAPCREGEDQKLHAHLAGVLDVARIDAEIQVIPEADSADLLRYSEGSSMVFFRMQLEGMRVVGPFGGALDELLPQLPISCIVGAARSVKLTEPEADDAVEGEPNQNGKE